MMPSALRRGERRRWSQRRGTPPLNLEIASAAAGSWRAHWSRVPDDRAVNLKIGSCGRLAAADLRLHTCVARRVLPVIEDAFGPVELRPSSGPSYVIGEAVRCAPRSRWCGRTAETSRRCAARSYNWGTRSAAAPHDSRPWSCNARYQSSISTPKQCACAKSRPDPSSRRPCCRRTARATLMPAPLPLYSTSGTTCPRSASPRASPAIAALGLKPSSRIVGHVGQGRRILNGAGRGRRCCGGWTS